MKLLQVLAWLLPASRFKNWLLRSFGHDVANSAHIGPVLAINLGHVAIGEGCRINGANIFRSLQRLELHDGAGIGQLNTISAFPGFHQFNALCGSLVMHQNSFITSRHYIDCSGGLLMGSYSALYGQRTTLLTHEIDMATNEQTAGRVVIGDRTAVLTNCVILKGARLPRRSLLAAHSTLTRAKNSKPAEGLYAGTPAKRIGPIRANGNSWFERINSATTKLRFDSDVHRESTDSI